MRWKKLRGGCDGVRHQEVASQAGIWAEMQAISSEFNLHEDSLVPHIHVWSSGSESVSTDSMNL